ncbi:dienelactone hydrolase family protein [Streptomyces sp. NBC_00019]|uniref:dienelactone hydrolase family protein n=1 Tax=Streptomyces sp. NBC_00019 TaxID=2975623 RepID=UPI0032449B94
MKTMIDIPTQDGTADAYLAHPDDGAPHPAVLLYMDAFGLRRHLNGMADRLASAGYTVLHLADRITAELYFGHADQDSTNPADQIARLDKTLTTAGVRHRAEIYPGAHHGFTRADTAMYSAEATDRHWTALLELLGRTL